MPWGALTAFAVTIDPVVSPTSLKDQIVTGTRDSGALVQVSTDGAVAGQVSYPGPGDTTWSVPLTGLLEGSNTITATADSGSPASATAVIVVDSTAPDLSLSTLADGTVTNNPILNVAGTATDGGAGIAGVTVNGSPVTVASDGSFSVLVTLNAGANQITTIATDIAGNSTQDIRTITLDQTSPQITVTTPADNSATNVSPATVSGSVDKSAVVEVAVNNGSSQAVPLNSSDFTTQVPLAAGTNTITITATDQAGNKATAKRTVVYDTTSPTIQITDPSQDMVTNQASYLVQGTAGDSQTTATVAITVDAGQPVAVALTNGAFSCQVPFAVNKSYQIVATATDAAGNKASATRNITYDNIPPTITKASSTTAAGYYAAGSSIDVSLTFSEPVYSSGLSITLSSGAVINSGPLAAAATFDTTYQVATGQDAAQLNVTAVSGTIADLAGNQNQAPAVPTGSNISNGVLIVIETTPPIATITAKPPNPVNARTGSFSFTVSEVGATAQCSLDGAAYAACVSPFNFDFTSKPDGSHAFSVRAVDQAANIGTPNSYSWTIDTTPPVVSAGQDRTVNTPFSQTGSVTDASSFTVQWSQVSGPGTITYGAPTMVTTTVTASQDGQYVLQLAAVDAAGNASSSTMTLIWNTVKPVVSAGANRAANGSFTQTGSVSDALPVTVQWSQFSGPGTITFGSSTALTTTVTASQDGQYQLQLAAADSAGNTATSTMNLTWDTVKPVVSAGANLAANSQITLTATASDATSLSYQWSQLSGAGTVTFGTPTSLSTTVSASQDGQYVLQLAATDAAGNTAASTMTLTWDTVKPIVSAGANVVTNSPVTLTGSVSDSLGVTYQWSQISGPGTVTFGSPQALATKAQATIDGVYTIAFTVTDMAGNVATAQLQLTWETTPPAVAANPNNTILYKNKAFIWTGQASSTLELPLSYAWSFQSGPAGSTVTFGTPTSLSTTLAASVDGAYAVRLTVTDSAGNSASSDLTFTWDTTPPTVTAGTGHITNAPFTQVGQATDSSPLAVVWNQTAGPPGGVTFGTPQVQTTTIQATSNGVYTVQLSATDAAGNTAASTMTFTWDTTAPTLSAGPNQIVNAPVTQTGTVSDATSVLLAWSQVSGPGQLTFGQPNTISTTISASQDGVYMAQLSATDAAGNVATSTMNLVWDTTPPTVSAGPNRTVNAPVTQIGSASDATALSYQWSLLSGPGTVAFSTVNASTTTMTASSDGVYIVQLAATDAAGNTAASTMTLTRDTTPPTVSAGQNRITNTTVTQTGSASDATPLTFLWTQTSGIGTLTFGSPSALTTTITASADGIYTARLSAMDAAGNSSYSEMKLTWATQAPTVSAGPPSAQNAQFTQTGFASGVTDLSYQWSQQSGSGTITFGSPQALTTTVVANQEGVYVLRLTATDAAGNVSYGEATITWDLTPPSLIISTLQDGSYTADKILSISGVVTDHLSGVGRFTINGAIATLDAVGNFSSSLTLNPGANVISSVAIDRAGNSIFDTRTIIYDSTVPTVIVTAPASADYKTNKANVTITGTVDFGCTVAIRITGPGPVQEISSVPVTNGGFTQQLSGLTPGLNSVEIIATSPAGQVGTKNISVTYETTRPVLTVDSPAGDIRAAQDSIIVSGTATDAMTNVTVKITVGQDSYAQSYTPEVVNGSYSQVVPLAANGLLYPLTVTATNEAGSETAVSRRVIRATPTGDIDGDGHVTVADALIALQIAVGMRQQTDSYLITGDVGPLVDGAPAPDWKIDISDAVLILRIVTTSLVLK